METVYDFELPRGYVDEKGGVHRKGKMRLATAADEILPLRDPRVTSNPGYLYILQLARTITELEGVGSVTTGMIERFFTADLAFLQDMYQRINNIEPPVIKVKCPHCGELIEVPEKFTQDE